MRRVQDRQSSPEPLLRSVWGAAGGRVPELRRPGPARGQVLRKLRQAPRRGGNGRAAGRAGGAAGATRDAPCIPESGGGLHAAASRRQDPPFAVRPRGRAPSGDRSLRRHRGLHHARREAGPGGRAPHHGPMLRADHGRGSPVRGHDQPVHRRRGDGALRRPDRSRGRPAPGRARRARGPAGCFEPTTGRRRVRAVSPCRCGSACTRGPSSWGRSATTSGWTTRRWATPPTWPRAFSRRPGPAAWW